MEIMNYSKVSEYSLMGRKNPKWIVVFLKNKLISFDSILPLALEINQCCHYKFYFIVWDYDSYISIVKDNIVLRDMALSIGQIICPGNPNKSIVSNKINKIILLASVVYKLYLKSSYIFHFGALDRPPLSLLTKLIRKNKIARCESALSGRYTENLKHIMEVGNIIDKKKYIWQQRSSQETFDKFMIGKYPLNNSGVLFGFDSSWNWLKHPDAINCKKLVFKEGKKAKSYTSFMEKNSDYYLRMEKLIDLDKTKTIIFILGHFGYSCGDVRNKLFYDALVVLRELQFNIIIKPHIFCDMGLVQSIIKKAKCPDEKVFFTKISPQVLQKIAIGGLFINTSTVRCDYKNAGFPIIQYNGGFSNVKIDSCSDIHCSDQSQLTNSLKILMKKFNDKKIIIKENEETIKSCDRLKKVLGMN